MNRSLGGPEQLLPCRAALSRSWGQLYRSPGAEIGRGTIVLVTHSRERITVPRSRYAGAGARVGGVVVNVGPHLTGKQIKRQQVSENAPVKYGGSASVHLPIHFDFLYPTHVSRQLAAVSYVGSSASAAISL
jgi:hypothetical protein